MAENKQKLVLNDILNFDGLREKYPKKRIKLRFNISWTEKDKNGQKVFRDYLKLYKSDDDKDKEFFRDSILSVFSAKRTRLFEKDIVFQFIKIEDGAENDTWLLVDAVNITHIPTEKKGYDDVTGANFEVAEAERLSEYEPFFNRLTVNWKNISQTPYYVEKSIVNNVEVKEILADDYLKLDEKFCGYENVSISYNDLKYVINKSSWKDALESVYGVYVLTDTSNGKLYIGSATGEQGIYGRWSTYLNSGFDKNEVENGEYPNKRLQQLVKTKGIQHIQKYFQYSILEIFPKNKMGADKALEREIYWKNVFRTKEKWGYNDN